jgi:hypothetical protein
MALLFHPPRNVSVFLAIDVARAHGSGLASGGPRKVGNPLRGGVGLAHDSSTRGFPQSPQKSAARLWRTHRGARPASNAEDASNSSGTSCSTGAEPGLPRLCLVRPPRAAC